MIEASTTQEAMIQKISQIDLKPIRKRLILKGYSEERADLAVTLYRKFLSLYAMYPDRNIVPPHIADMAWHEHILMTRRYYTDMMHVFGRMVHHDPEAYGTVEFDEATDDTRTLLDQHFGIAMGTEADLIKTAPAAKNDLAPEWCFAAKGDKTAAADAQAKSDVAPEWCFAAKGDKTAAADAQAKSDLAPEWCFATKGDKTAAADTQTKSDLAPEWCFAAKGNKTAAADAQAKSDLAPEWCFAAKGDKTAAADAQAKSDLAPEWCFAKGEKSDQSAETTGRTDHAAA